MYKNELGIREVTREEAENLGIDLSMVKACKTLRRLAKLDRLTLDETVHRSGLNKHLFDYVEYCGDTPIHFIKEYLSNLQPYMLERKKEQEKENSFLCVIDKIYRISVYIKADRSFGEEMVISFHEDNIRGVAKTNDVIKQSNDRLVPVFIDSIGSVAVETGNASVRLFVQRGMKVLPMDIVGFQCGEVFIVRERDINTQFLEYCNQYIRDLYTSDLKLDFEQIEVFSILQQISFTSYGRDTFSSISLLIDSLTIQKDVISKQVADFALVTFTQSLLLTEEQKKELLELLEMKYRVTSIKGIDTILGRVRLALTQSLEKDPFGELLATEE